MKAYLRFESTPAKIDPIRITGSKSETNRLLILQSLYKNLSILNVSESDNSKYLSVGLENREGVIDIHHAGTAMRFLTAYFACKANSEVILTGSDRMKERPISILVDALRDLGAQIEYVEREGFPPLKISGTAVTKSNLEIKANVSSQYISALMLVAPSLPNGLKIDLVGQITSVPYIEMTLSLLKRIGVSGSLRGNTIEISNLREIEETILTVESDWSSASYFYSWVALSENTSVTLQQYRGDSLQGDAALQDIYKELGVKTNFSASEGSISLSKQRGLSTKNLYLDLSNTPDLAQTIAVTCFGLNIGCELTGLHTLKIKETDRLVALKTELEKLGAKVIITENSLRLVPQNRMLQNIEIDTYNDHRMAMAFAPLAQKIPLSINDPKVVSKSYPKFWDDLKTVGVTIDFE